MGIPVFIIMVKDKEQMTEDKELQDIIRKIDELREIIEAHMVEINKDLENLFTHDLRLEDKIYEIDARVEDLEKSK